MQYNFKVSLFFSISMLGRRIKRTDVMQTYWAAHAQALADDACDKTSCVVLLKAQDQAKVIRRGATVLAVESLR